LATDVLTGKGDLMNKQTKSIAAERDGGVAMSDLLLTTPTLSASVIVGAIFEPKLPPLRGD